MMNMLQAVALSAVLVTTGAVTADAGGSGGKRPTKPTTLAADAPTPGPGIGLSRPMPATPSATTPHSNAGTNGSNHWMKRFWSLFR